MPKRKHACVLVLRLAAGVKLKNQESQCAGHLQGFKLNLKLQRQRQRPNLSQRRDLLSLRKLRRWRKPSLMRKHQTPLLRMVKPKLRKRHQLQTQLNKKMKRQNNISPTTSFTSAPCTSFLVQFRGIFLSTIF